MNSLLSQIIAALSASAGLTAGIYSLVKLISNSRTKKRASAVALVKEQKEADSSEARETFEQSKELMEIIREEVRLALIDPLKTIDDLKHDLSALRDRARAKDTVIRRIFHRLFLWKEGGMRGPMPTPNEEEMGILDILDIQADTKTAAEIDQIRAAVDKAAELERDDGGS